MISTWRVILLVATLVAVAARDIGAACKSTCTEELRACRAQCHDATNRRACRQQCADASTCTAPGVRARTVGYTVNECRQDATGYWFHERLLVRRGNCDPVTVMDLTPVRSAPDDLDICGLYGRLRSGTSGVVLGRFQRIGMTPDGTGLVIEITNDHAVPLFAHLSPEPPEEGIFYMRTDGRDLPGGGKVRRVSAPSAVPIIDALLTPVGGPVFAISPNNRIVAFEDLGPDADGQIAPQVFVIDLATDQGKKQITRLPPALPDARQTGSIFFAGEQTVQFWNGTGGERFTVETDGKSPPRPIPSSVTVPGAVIPEFAVAGKGTSILPVHFPDRTPVDGYQGDPFVREEFVLDGPRVVQLTTFGFRDTGFVSTIGRNRLYFSASANPDHNQNPQGICQIFSVSPLGGRLRQITHFPEDGRPKNGCRPIFLQPSACTMEGLAADPVTGALVFRSSCDPLGRARNGEQFFAMRPDGTGLRQTSDFQGVEPLPDGGVTVEMPGVAAYSFVVR